ncbi:hypothetical protein GCM10023220_30380 [Streptomyces ziwulingensis]|uniref:Uncharacterized protein n=1 Tax=Streptomyces ziwulingensis TaxID=1045501 RepID=A0ABP9BUW7_9ACTN
MEGIRLGAHGDVVLAADRAKLPRKRAKSLPQGAASATFPCGTSRELAGKRPLVCRLDFLKKRLILPDLSNTWALRSANRLVMPGKSVPLSISRSDREATASGRNQMPGRLSAQADLGAHHCD